MNPLDLARPELLALAPYSSARMEAQDGAVWLNANESPWPPVGVQAPWNRYPEPQCAALLKALSGLYGVASEQVLVGRGSDEAIDLLVRVFCRAEHDAILISPPTFGMYAVGARVQGAAVIEVPLRADFSIDVEAVLAALTPAVKLVFVCSPNNPTGVGVPRDRILALANAVAGRALLVVDEAYVEFADPHGGFGSVAGNIDRYPNLVVLRTLSKAWALAGVRIGAMLADARIVALARKLMPPYPLPSPCVEIALHALADEGRQQTRERVRSLCAERERLRVALQRIACVRDVVPSQANFLAVRFVDAEAASRGLQAAGIVVRDARRHARLGDALRITIGTVDENDRVLAVLRALPDASLHGRAVTIAEGCA